MVFSSISFLILFLPITVFLYYVVPNRTYRNIVLCVVSVLFYAMGEPLYVLLLVASTVVNYALTRLMCAAGRPKVFLTAIVLINVGMLCFFKFNDSVHLPIGISFYTFQMLSYCIDVYRDRSLLQKNYFRLLLYISFFPQLIAGPIVRYADIAEQIDGRTHSADKCYAGLKRFILGLSKKVLIANTASVLADYVFGIAGGRMNCAVAWIGAAMYCLQIYYDFSGYSDMAIGLGKIFGFEFKENFLHPYDASSIKEFWTKWHISLSTWFKEYLYIPLGGNRKGRARTVLNKYIVFLCTGLWHGGSANYVIWGLIHGTFSLLEEKGGWAGRIKGKLIGRIYTLLVVLVAFVFFRSESVMQALCVLASMIGMYGGTAGGVSWSAFAPMLDGWTIAVSVIGAVCAFDIFGKLKGKPDRTFDSRTACARECVAAVLSVACYVLCVMSLASSSYNPFIYFRF